MTSSAKSISSARHERLQVGDRVAIDGGRVAPLAHQEANHPPASEGVSTLRAAAMILSWTTAYQLASLGEDAAGPGVLVHGRRQRRRSGAAHTREDGWRRAVGTARGKHAGLVRVRGTPSTTSAKILRAVPAGSTSSSTASARHYRRSLPRSSPEAMLCFYGYSAQRQEQRSMLISRCGWRACHLWDGCPAASALAPVDQCDARATPPWFKEDLSDSSAC
jgi:hypothetical protein